MFITTCCLILDGGSFFTANLQALQARQDWFEQGKRGFTYIRPANLDLKIYIFHLYALILFSQISKNDVPLHAVK